MKFSWTTVLEVTAGVVIGSIVAAFAVKLLSKYLSTNFDFDFEKD